MEKEGQAGERERQKERMLGNILREIAGVSFIGSKELKKEGGPELV